MLGDGRPQCDRLHQMHLGRGVLAFMRQQSPQRVMRAGMKRRRRHRVGHHLSTFGELALIQEAKPQQIKIAAILRMGGNGLAIERLGLGGPTGLMQGHGPGQLRVGFFRVLVHGGRSLSTRFRPGQSL